MTKIVIFKIINYVEHRADRSLFQRKVYQEHFYKVSCKSDKYFLKYPDNGVSSARKRKSEKTCPKRRQLFRQQDFTVKKHFERSVEVTDARQKWNHSPAPSVNESFVCPRQVVPSILCTSFLMVRWRRASWAAGVAWALEPVIRTLSMSWKHFLV